MDRTADTSVDAYADPSVYDILHTPGTAEEVDLLERLHRGFGAPAGPWLEPACGSGRYLRVLAGRGRRLVAFDRDAGMLDYARRSLRRRGLSGRVRLYRADLADFAGPLRGERFAFAFVLVNTLRHLLLKEQVRRHLEQMRASLRPGGLYVVGISFARYGEEEPTEDLWQARRGRTAVHQTVQYLPADPRSRRETVYSHLRVVTPSGERYLDSSYGLRAYDEAQWARTVRRAGLERIGAIDDLGRDVLADRPVVYQLEVLRARQS